MFGIDTLDIVIGLMFVYLLLSLICSAVNEYIAGLTNRRGAVLFEGIKTLVKDPVVAQAVMSHPLIQGMYTSDGKHPSYIPARSFAMALLDTLGYRPGSGGTVANTKLAAAAPADAARGTGAQPGAADRHPMHDVINLLQQDALGDVVEFVTDPDTLKNANLPSAVRDAAAAAAEKARTDYQKLHDSVEVWFNNGMDRVSGVYKRYTQLWLLGIGLTVTLLTNADTLGLWRTIAGSEAVRAGLVARAQEYAKQTAPPPAGATGDLAAARARLDTSVDALRGTGLQFGWSQADMAGLGLADPPAGMPEPSDGQKAWNWVAKIVGLLLTVTALSLGAPFWFDTLNKIINVRAAGRAPDERAKSPEAPGKRLAEQPTK